MTGPSLKNLHDIIKAAALTHPSVKSFGTGERHMISPDGGTESILVWLEQPFFSQLLLPSPGSPTRVNRIQILVLDIPLEDKSDELDVISRCDLVAYWIILRLNENSDLILGQEISVLSLSAYHDDKWAGVRIEMELITALPLGSCDVRNID